MNRREFISSGLMAALAAGCKCPFCGRGARKAAQAYPLRDLLKRDFEGTFAGVAKLGFEGMELWNPKGFDAKRIRRNLDANGLVACGSHVGIDLLAPANLAWTFDYAETVGFNRLIVPWLSPDAKEQDVPGWWKRQADVMNAAAAAAAKRGLKVGYHNHVHEFGTSFGGKTVWEIFAGALEREVLLQWDVGALVNAGQDAAAWIRKYPGRCETIHLRDNWDNKRQSYGVIGEPPAGERGVDWQAVAAALRENPVEWAIVEPTSSDRLDTFARSLVRLEEFGI